MINFSQFAPTFIEAWRSLSTLVKMQLKEKMDMSYLRSVRGIIFKTVWLLIEFAAITAVITIVLDRKSVV